MGACTISGLTSSVPHGNRPPAKYEAASKRESTSLNKASLLYWSSLIKGGVLTGGCAISGLMLGTPHKLRYLLGSEEVLTGREEEKGE